MLFLLTWVEWVRRQGESRWIYPVCTVLGQATILMSANIYVYVFYLYLRAY